MILKNVRLSYVKVAEPEENLNGSLAYSCCVLIKKTDKENLAAIEEVVKAAVKKGIEKKWGGKKPKFRYDPVRDGDAELKSGDREGAEYKGCMFFNASALAKFGKPGLVDENLNPIMDNDKIYSGCYCNIDVNPYPYDNSGNRGIGWGLQNVMFVSDGERLDGRQSAEAAFEHLVPEDQENQSEDEAF